jgi:uncharacterized protein YkwD
MKGKLVITFMIATAMLIVACGARAPVETSAPPPTETLLIPITGATATETPAATEISTTSTATLESTSTSTPQSRPTNAPDCTNSASFVTDVTIPDNIEMMGGTSFTKTWRVVNTGTCVWASDYTLAPYTGERMSAPASVPLALTYPGQALDISVQLKTPNRIGKYEGYFVIKNETGKIMKINSDSRLWTVINVKSLATATNTAVSGAATATPLPGAVNVSATVGASGNGFATVTCTYVLDPAKVTEVINAVNAYRAQSGLPAYNVNPQLTLAAQAHANDMACNNLFAHTGSNGSTPQSRIVVSGYVASSASENVYGSYPPLSGQGAVDWWKHDKTDLRHNLNLVSDKFVDIGVGYSFFNNYGYYVIVFAAP